jgi:RinA family phage transcriptional activator
MSDNLITIDDTQLHSATFKHIENEIRIYHQTLKEIEIRRMEIMHRYTPTDTNIGGGKSNLPGDPTGRTATALTDDLKLETLERIVTAIEFVWQGLTDEKKKLVKLYYWTRPQTLTWDGIALELNVSKMTASRWRKEIVISVAQFTGWR